ncbi:BCCT family transporter [Nesterenkonia aerolata]|uniref:BCCT family transporter n=1 Tax=Nesterenkonia aerolata TaxID=3074079 RepID=A0ABU2DRF7_9MICC|nr:BCCT family transporter [Nesterenkonia sp. LY-0111]MDR8019089.1 BCCT family transporter [Nesterenkonia sp. LY-0111]
MPDDRPTHDTSHAQDDRPTQEHRAPQPGSPSANPVTCRAGRRTGLSLEQLSVFSQPDYPHDIHPALVPGIGIDEQRRRYRLDHWIFAVAGTLTVAFIAWGLISPSGVGDVAGAVFGWTMDNASWLFNALAAVVLVFMLIIAFSRYGHIRLGRDGDEPEFSTFSWVAMLFAAGIGIGVFFFGPSEPLSHYQSPPPGTAAAETAEALHTGMAYTYFHWGFHAWAIYALVGASVAYAAYRRGRVPLMSSIFRTMLGQRHTDGLPGRIIDIFALFATLFGTAAALGLASLQITEGIGVVTGATLGTGAVVLVILVLALAFIASAISGVARGIRYLSSINIVLVLSVLGLVFLLGPTMFLLNMLPSALMEHFSTMFEMLGRSASWGQETVDFQAIWTVFYWAWWISWSPFVGIFIARVSRGRTLRQFILGVTLVPSSVLFLAFGILGGTSIWMYRNDAPGFEAEMSPPEVLFTMIDNLPYAQWLPIVVMIVLSIFFITSADSAAVVMGILSTSGDQNPHRAVVVFWGLVMAGVAVIMLLTGGDTALTGLQNLVIVTALPFAAVLVLIMVAFVRELRTDPAALRGIYAEKALADAVVTGIDSYGDDFRLQVGQSPPGAGAGAEIDSEHEKYTDWYRRTDEDGRPVEYDFETGEWGDGWDPEEDSRE